MLKLTAALLMVLDHFAVIFLDSTSQFYLFCRMLGRLAMPIFAYKVALGFIYTRYFKRYLLKIGLMTVVAQIPFTLMYYGENFSIQFESMGYMLFFQQLNIGWTFICSLLLLHFLQGLFNKQKLTLSELIPILVLALMVQFGDYGLYGFLNILTFYLFIKFKFSYAICASLLFVALVFYSFIFYGEAALSMINSQLTSILSLFLIAKVDDSKKFISKYFFYYFYPLHMLVLLGIQSLL